MISSTVDVSEVKPFPKLMISNRSGNVVLFSSQHEGTVLYIGAKDQSSLKLGDYSDEFSPNNFSDFYGSITLVNK